MAYDVYGNRIQVIEPNGATRQIRYDYLGRPQSYTDERGKEVRYVYDARGLLRAIQASDGLSRAFAHDAEGRLARLTLSDGQTYELSWAGLNAVHRVTKPDGTFISYRYDREGALVRVINERGEVHRLMRDPAGRVVAEQTFDGRRLRYKLNASGNAITTENGAGEKTEVVYDECGRVVARTYHDDTKDTFEYDALGRVIVASNDRVQCTFSYDVRGRRVQESQRIHGEAESITSEYDSLDRRISVVSSRGSNRRIEHRSTGAVARLSLDNKDTIDFTRDSMGAETSRVLPGGGVVQTLRDASGTRIRYRVLRAPRPDEATVPGEPDWVGERPVRTVDEKSFVCNAEGDIATAAELDGRVTRYSYDTLGQILARAPSDAPAEVFQYDEVGNLHEVAPGSANRQYSAGGKLVRRGDVEYTYDNEGRLTRQHTVTASGASSAWTYEWNGRGLLSAVNTPTGSRVQFEYDPFARRIEKSVVSREGVRDRTRFVYDVDSLLHEIRDRLAEDGERIVEERTYTFEPGGLAAIAHQDITLHGNQRVVSPRVYYVNGGGAFAERLLSGEGHVISRAPHGVWGDVGVEGIGTPLRFAGQYADEETGLAYNRNRYYEAESGRYISRDPIGLEGGLRIFGYAGNRPSALIDPEGLVAVISTTTRAPISLMSQ
jgi:RHS repeat-associated protein